MVSNSLKSEGSDARVSFFLLVSALSTAQSAKNEEPMLTVTLTSDRTNYSLGDDIRLDVRVTNAGKSPLTVLGQLLRGHA